MKRSPRYFAHYWKQQTSRREENDFPETQFEHAAGNLFRRRGVQPGDIIYGWSIRDKNLYLIGRMQVDKYVSQQEADAHYEEYGCSAWEADDHVFAADGTATLMRFGRTIPLTTIKQIEFLSPKGEVKPPKFVAGDELDQQTLRGVRELTSKSAALLDSLIEDEF